MLVFLTTLLILPTGGFAVVGPQRRRQEQQQRTYPLQDNDSSTPSVPYSELNALVEEKRYVLPSSIEAVIEAAGLSKEDELDDKMLDAEFLLKLVQYEAVASTLISNVHARSPSFD